MQLYKVFHHIVPGATRSINPIEQKLILHTKRNSLCTVVAYTNVFDRKNAITFFMFYTRHFDRTILAGIKINWN